MRSLPKQKEQTPTVNFGMFELPCMHTIVEKNVNFTKGAVLGLGKPEPTPDVAKQVGPGIE